MKNPSSVAFLKQANIANGPQQVNNEVPPSRAREIESQQTKLLEAEHGQRLDTGAASTTSRANQELATVGAIDGPRTPAGKARVSQNGYQGAVRERLRELAKLLRDNSF